MKIGWLYIMLIGRKLVDDWRYDMNDYPHLTWTLFADRKGSQKKFQAYKWRYDGLLRFNLETPWFRICLWHDIEFLNQ